MATNQEKTISSMYAELNKFKQTSDYDRALKIANKILRSDPNETTAFHCKIVCLLQLSKFEEALNSINKNSEAQTYLHFEKAYCLYRLNDPQSALQVLESATEKTNEINELKAQILYRLEKFDECYNLYRDIIKKSNDDYEHERQANLSAVVANMTVKDVTNPEPNTYEICFNHAYKLVQEERFSEAEKNLKICEKMCREYFAEDGYTEEEIEIELAIIKVQLAYCYQKSNRTKDAQQIYKNILALKLDDIGLVAVASNNMVVINKDHNVFDSKKKMKHATTDLLTHKLNNEQRKKIALNNCLLGYYMGQNEVCRKSCEKLAESWPELTVQASIIKSMLLIKENNVDKAVNSLQNLKISSESEKLYVDLVCVHLLLCQNDTKRACDILHNLNKVTSYRPGIVGALVALYVGQNDVQKAAEIFENAVSFYRKSQNSQSRADVGNMWLQAAQFHMSNGNPKVAINCLEEVLNTNPNNLWTISKLIIAQIQHDAKQAKKLSEKLPSIEELTKNVQFDDIESSNWIFGLKSSKPKGDNASPSTPKSEIVQKTKKHRKRKGKLPKNAILDATPDPERWLPKYERTGFKKKRDRRAKDVIKGSQGQNTGSSDQYDFSKNVEEAQTSEKHVVNVESPSPKTTGSGGHRKGGQKSRKKKGKW